MAPSAEFLCEAAHRPEFFQRIGGGTTRTSRSGCDAQRTRRVRLLFRGEPLDSDHEDVDRGDVCSRTRERVVIEFAARRMTHATHEDPLAKSGVHSGRHRWRCVNQLADPHGGGGVSRPGSLPGADGHGRRRREGPDAEASGNGSSAKPQQKESRRCRNR